MLEACNYEVNFKSVQSIFVELNEVYIVDIFQQHFDVFTIKI